MQKINKTLNQRIKKYKIEEKVKAEQLLKAWEKVISDFLPNAAKKTMALAFEKGVLKIASLSKEIAYEIHLYQKRLVEALNNYIGKNLVYRIICEI